MKTLKILSVCFTILFSTNSLYSTELQDCGPLSLVTIANSFGLDITTASIYNLIGGQADEGLSMLELLWASKMLELPVVAAKITKQQLIEYDAPMIAFVDSSHYLVIHGCTWFNTHVIIQEPSEERKKVRINDLMSRWGGEALIYSEKAMAAMTKYNDIEKAKQYFGPRIFIDNRIELIAPIHEGDVVSGTYKITNIGSDTLNVYARSSCSCVTTSINYLEIAPRSSNELVIDFDTIKMRGLQHQSTLLKTNDPNNPEIKLSIVTSVLESEKLYPNKLQLGNIVHNTSVSKIVRVLLPREKTIKIKQVDIPKAFNVQILPAITDAHYEKHIPVEITYNATDKPSTLDETLYIVLDSGEKLPLLVQGEIIGDYKAYPPVVFLGQIKQNKSITRGITLVPTNKNTGILSNISSKSPYIKTDVVDIDGETSKELILTYTSPAKPGTDESTIQVFTKGDSTPTLEIPVYAEIVP